MPYTLVAKQGSIFDEPHATFIVNPSNTQLILGSGVSGAFARECGPELQEEMNRALLKIKGGLKQGDIVATSSGRSQKFEIALHAAVMNYDPGTKQLDKYPTLQTVSDALKNIENYLQWYAKNKSPKIKLVLPMMGCGVGRLSIEDVAKLYIDFFNKEVDYNCEVIIYNLHETNHEMVKNLISNQT